MRLHRLELRISRLQLQAQRRLALLHLDRSLQPLLAHLG
jgi:hypothetical protein